MGGASGRIAGISETAAGQPAAWDRFARWDRIPTRLALLALALLFLGASLGVLRYFFVMHDLWAGMLLALAFGLHRPAREGEGARWGAAWAAAALALAIRETALPFVLLMAAFSAWRRSGKECAAWCALIALFAAALAIHSGLVAQHVGPGDPESSSWLVMRGLGGWVSNVVETTNLRLLPAWLGWPLAVLAVFGWTGWNSPAGTFGALLYSGYGAAFMIAGRADNYYWGFLVAPAILMGLAFAPRALRSLIAAACSPAPPAPARAKTLRGDRP